MVGQQVGKYRVLDRIGKGGMGTVYRAMDEMLHRDVAIKVLNAELNDPEVAKRFRAEAITVARLSHPGIATIYELFEHDGQWLMVMEFVRGETLEAMVTRMGPLSAQRSAELCMQALAALAHAHSMGVVHRDLKPANLMITENGAIKVMDFGIARVSGSEHLTNAGFMMGTPAYMAPEQVRGGEVDARADLYAMGVVFFRLTTGKLPFKGDTAFAMAQSQVSEPPTPVATIRADLPAWVEEIVTRALAKGPEQRFQSAAEFHEALARCMAGLPISSMYTSSGETMLTPSRMPSGAISSRPMPAMPTPSASFPMPTPIAQQAMASGAQQTVMSGSHPASAEALAGKPASTNALAGGIAPSDPTIAAPSGATERPAFAKASAGPDSVKATPASAKATDKAGKKPIPLVWIGIAGAVVLTVVVVAITVLRGGSDDQPPAVSPTPTSAPVATPAPAPASGGDALATTTPAPPLPTATATPTPSRAVGPPLPTMTPARGAAPTASPSAPGATPSPTPAPAAGADSAEAFSDAKMFLITGKRDVKDAVIHFGNGQVALTVKGANTMLATLAYKRITHATYVHARDPQWDASLSSPPKDFNASSFMGSLLSRSAKHWLVLQGTDHCEILRLDDSNFKKILDMLEARTGVKIDRK